MCKLDSIIKHLTTHERRCTASFLSVNYALISSKYVRINTRTVCTNCGGGYPICSITKARCCVEPEFKRERRSFEEREGYTQSRWVGEQHWEEWAVTNTH